MSEKITIQRQQPYNRAAELPKIVMEVPDGSVVRFDGNNATLTIQDPGGSVRAVVRGVAWAWRGEPVVLIDEPSPAE